jgi:hypothetical protein
MKTTQAALLLVLSFFLLSLTCTKSYKYPCPELQLDNQTDKPLYVLFSFDYPDTSLNFQHPLTNIYTNKIAAHSKAPINVYNVRNCLESYFDMYSVDKISIFVFDAVLVDTTPWNKIRQNYQVMKRYDLAKDEIGNNNYTITLP